MLRFLSLTVVAGLGLAGCVTPTTQPLTTAVAPNAAASIPVSASVGPASAFIDARDAGVLFARICVANRSSANGSRAVIATLPFTQNSGTRTYYHDTVNLSVSLSNGDCSLIFFTDDPSAGGDFADGVLSTGVSVSEKNDVTFTARAHPNTPDVAIINARIRP